VLRDILADIFLVTKTQTNNSPKTHVQPSLANKARPAWQGSYETSVIVQ